MRLLPSLLLMLLALPTLAAERPAPARPKLVVTIIVDQLRYDYMERFYPQFEGGFKRLIEGGAFMTFARYPYYPTITGPGHASFMSGSGPAVHGIIGNDYFDKKSGHMLYCCEDDSVQGLGTTTKYGQMSPRNFIGSTFADEMRLAYHSKVIGMSIKDRGAILPSGKKPAQVVWFESGTGNFISSTYYGAELPKWVQQFNERKVPASYIGQKWDRLLPEKEYQYGDSLPGEGGLQGEKTVTFPHQVEMSKSEGFETVIPTPYGNDLLVQLAKAAVEAEQLGQGPQTDVLHISFSSNDYCGHRFGPYSQEVQDITLRLDRQLGDFFTFLDQKVGADNYAVVLSADHGVVPAPEFAKDQGLDGERPDMLEIMPELLGKVKEKFGASDFFLNKRPVEGAFYFDYPKLAERNVEPNTLATFIRDWALSSGRYMGAFTREQLLRGEVGSQIGQRVLAGYHPERSGDVVLINRPYSIAGPAKVGTTHGSPHSYDAHVPVFFYGTLFKPGRYADEFYVTDIAPTLCAALHVEQPAAAVGKPCPKVLADNERLPQARPARTSSAK